MPNWCYNRVTAYGNRGQLKEIEKIFESKTPFNDYIPPTRLEEHTKREGRVTKVRAMKKPDGSIAWETYNFPRW